MNNRQRRAAKQRKRENRRHRSSGFSDDRRGSHHDLVAAIVLAVLAEVDADRSTTARHAERLTGPDAPAPAPLIASLLHELLQAVLVAAIHDGWAPSDLAHVVRRQLDPQHVPPLAALLETETARHPRSKVSPFWRDELAALGPAVPADLATPDGMALSLGLCALLQTLPVIAEVIPPPGTVGVVADGTREIDAKVLGRVRGLLAKAEATEFADEAEALSAKAQELISRYALDHLAHEADKDGDGDRVSVRRIWIDPPYVVAKALLVDAVASANRCRSVIAEALGYSAIVGVPSDLRAVELLTTSLLVQANAAMLRHGSQADRAGTSRTTSFRRSFLVAYASRIGERLRASTDEATVATGRAGALVPVLRRHAERVDATTEQLFPRLRSVETSVSNGHGWMAGRAAADLALFDTQRTVTEAAAT